MVFDKTLLHTQEKRATNLSAPVECIHEDAWLGRGWYFWFDVDDAHNWGRQFKRATGYYQIYSARVATDKVFDTVFNEKQYLFWLETIELVLNQLAKNPTKVTLQDLNEFLADDHFYDDVDIVMFQDISPKQKNVIGGGVFHYKKRIQIAVFKLSVVSDFKLYLENRC